MNAVVLVLAVVAGARGEALAALEAVLPPYLLQNVEDLVKAASSACDILPLEMLSSRQHAAELARLQVVEVGRGGGAGAGARRTFRAAAAPRHLRRWRLAAAAELPLYVPGWWNSPSDEAADALVAALLRHHPTVLVLDTRRAFGRGYLAAAARVGAVARRLAALVEALGAAGVAPAALHVVGFSLGAHVAGAAGRLVRRRLGARLGRITALDPARPCFARSELRVRRGDAEFVQVVHSSAGVLGLEAPAGHADVYVNGLRGPQPQCRHRALSVECDHNVAWRLFAASAAAPGPVLQARRCGSWRELAAGACAGERVPLGYHCPAAARGIFLYTSNDTFADAGAPAD